MGKFKKIFLNIFNLLKETFQKFPITIGIIYFTTLIFTFGTDDFVEIFLEDSWFFMMGVWIIGTLFVEKFWKNKYIRAIGGVVSLLIAYVFRYLLVNDIVAEYFIYCKIMLTYMMVLPIITIYKMLKDTEVPVKVYAIRVLSNIAKTATIYLLANLGILIVFLVFVNLILDGNDFDILPRILVLLLGGFFIPAMIQALTDVKTETGKFIKILLTRILMPVALFLICTLYLYVIKIMINGAFLKESLFFILSLTFSLTIPGVILLKNYEEDKWVLNISNILFYLFIPLIILQIISMNVRVQDYGLTESRYIGYLLIVFEIIFISLMIIKKSKHLDKIVLVFAGFVVWSVLTPFSIFDVPVYSQTGRITNMLKKVESFEDLSREEKNECKKAYIYVKKSENSEYLDKKLSVAQKEEIENYRIDNEYDYREREYEYLSMYNRDVEIDITGYKKLYVAENKYIYNEEIDVNNYEITDRNEKVKVIVDLENFIKEMYKAEKENNKESTFEKVRYLKTNDENIIFYVTDFNLSYELYSNSLDHISMDGYLLVK